MSALHRIRLGAPGWSLQPPSRAIGGVLEPLNTGSADAQLRPALRYNESLKEPLADSREKGGAHPERPDVRRRVGRQRVLARLVRRDDLRRRVPEAEAQRRICACAASAPEVDERPLIVGRATISRSPASSTQPHVRQVLAQDEEAGCSPCCAGVSQTKIVDTQALYRLTATAAEGKLRSSSTSGFTQVIACCPAEPLRNRNAAKQMRVVLSLPKGAIPAEGSVMMAVT